MGLTTGRIVVRVDQPSVAAVFAVALVFPVLRVGPFLVQVSRLPLHLTPTHPRSSCRAGVPVRAQLLVRPFLFAHGTMVSARVANGIMHAGSTLRQY